MKYHVFAAQTPEALERNLNNLAGRGYVLKSQHFCGGQFVCTLGKEEHWRAEVERRIASKPEEQTALVAALCDAMEKALEEGEPEVQRAEIKKMLIPHFRK